MLDQIHVHAPRRIGHAYAAIRTLYPQLRDNRAHVPLPQDRRPVVRRKDRRDLDTGVQGRSSKNDVTRAHGAARGMSEKTVTTSTSASSMSSPIACTWASTLALGRLRVVSS